MKIFSDRFEDLLVNIIGIVVVASIFIAIFGIVGGIEQGLIW